MTDDGSIFHPVNLKTAFDIGKTLVSFARQAESKGLDSQYAAELNSKIADIQFALMDAQADALASQEAQAKQSTRIRELEQTISEFENWEAEKARYRLVEVGWVFIYLLRKEAAREDEPPHYICPHCYNHGKKSILQYYRGMKLTCPDCETDFRVNYEVASSHGVLK